MKTVNRGPVPLSAIERACIKAISVAEKKHAHWSRGVTMRAAPESLVQTLVAEAVAKEGMKLLLEVSVADMKRLQRNEPLTEDDAATRKGRVDLAVYNESDMPRFIIEIKKLSGSGDCILEDCRRIHDLLAACPSIQRGLILGYTVATKQATINNRIESARVATGCKVSKRLKVQPVVSKKGASRLLGAAVFRVGRQQARP